MNRETKNYKVHIFDDEYVLITDESEEHIIQSATAVDSLMKELAQKSRITDAKKLAVLAALRIASKALALENDLIQRTQKEAELIKQLEQNLQNLTQ